MVRTIQSVNSGQLQDATLTYNSIQNLAAFLPAKSKLSEEETEKSPLNSESAYDSKV